MKDRALDEQFYSLIDNSIGGVDYLADDFNEVSSVVDNFGNAGNIWLVLSKMETISFLEGQRSKKIVTCDASSSRSEQAILLSDIKMLEDLVTKVKQNQLGNIQMGHYGEISFSRRGIKGSSEATQMLKHLFGDNQNF